MSLKPIRLMFRKERVSLRNSERVYDWRKWNFEDPEKSFDSLFGVELIFRRQRSLCHIYSKVDKCLSHLEFLIIFQHIILM